MCPPLLQIVWMCSEALSFIENGLSKLALAAKAAE
jgi:hypothetical protein